MAERLRRRNAGLARVDDLAVFRREPAQVDDVRLETPLARNQVPRNAHDPPRLRHLAGTALVAAR